MKKAKVNSVYEGRGRKRRKEREKESENSSKSARMSAKGRTDGIMATKALSIIPNNRTMVTRSMAMKTKEQKDEETLYEVDVIQAKEEEKNDGNKPMELVLQQQSVNEVVEVENKGDDGGLLTLDDWPMTCSYEEEWPWFKVGYECGWYSYWETMNGDFWTPMRNDKEEPVWNDDLWDFKDDNETKKP